MSTGLRQTLVALLAGPILFTVHFWGVYLTAEWDCRFGSSNRVTVVVTLVATVVAAAATGWLTWRSYRHRQDDDPDDVIALAGLLLSGISVVAVLFVGVTALVLPPC